MIRAAAAWVLITVPVLWAQQGPPALVREGTDWIETVRSATAAPMARLLTVEGLANVAIEGGDSARLVTTLRKRVMAATEQDARRLLEACSMQTRLMGSEAVVSVRTAENSRVMTELMIESPAEVRRVVARSGGGSMRFSNLRADIAAITAGGPMFTDAITGSVDLQTGGGSIEVGIVSAMVRAVTQGGPIRVRQASGPIRLQTGGGQIFVEQAGSSVEAITQAGAVSITKAGGEVIATTGGGEIHVGEAAGPVRAINVAGRIDIGGARGVECGGRGPIRLRNISGRMQVSSSSGSIFAELSRALDAAGSVITTQSGDIVVLVPSNLPVTIEAWNQSRGRLRQVVSDFPEIKMEAPERARGALNGGGPVLRIVASDGTIYLRKRE